MLRSLCSRRAIAAWAVKRFVAAPSDLLPRTGAWIGEDGRFERNCLDKVEINKGSSYIHVDSLTGEGIWLPGHDGDEIEIEASSVKKKRRKKMNKHKHKKLRRRNRHSKKKK